MIVFFASAFISEVAGTLAGFGSSTIFLPIALLFLDFKNALVLVALLHLFGNLSRIGLFKEGLDKKMIIHFGVPSVIFGMLGAALVSQASQEVFKGLLGVFLVSYSVIYLLKENPNLPVNGLSTSFGGAVSGFLAGLIGTGGVLRGAFLNAFGLPKRRYVATAAFISMGVDVTRIPVYLSQNFLGPEFYSFVLPLFIVALLGVFVGRRIVRLVPQKTFRKMVLVAILAIGIKFSLNVLTFL